MENCLQISEVLDINPDDIKGRYCVANIAWTEVNPDQLILVEKQTGSVKMAGHRHDNYEKGKPL